MSTTYNVGDAIVAFTNLIFPSHLAAPDDAQSHQRSVLTKAQTDTTRKPKTAIYQTALLRVKAAGMRHMRKSALTEQNLERANEHQFERTLGACRHCGEWLCPYCTVIDPSKSCEDLGVRCPERCTCVQHQ